MEQHRFVPDRQATPYHPSGSVALAAAASGIITFEGYQGRPFGVTRILNRVAGEQSLRQVRIAGGAAGNHTVTGIALGDTLISVLHHTQGADMADLTSEFSITATDTINNAAGTNTTSDDLIVLYQDNPPYLSDFTVTLTLDGRQVIFEDVHASALQAMFQYRPLKAPIVIPAGRSATLEYTNNGDSTQTIYAEMGGYTQDDLEEYIAWAERNYQGLGQPWFIWAPMETLAASVVDRRVTINTGDKKLWLERLFIGSTRLTDIRASLRVDAVTYIGSVMAEMHNDRFMALEAPHPIPLESLTPIEVYATNLATVGREFSVLGECYIRR